MTDQWSQCEDWASVPIFGGPAATWNKHAAPVLQYVTKRVEVGSRYGVFLADGWRRGERTWFQTAACRDIRGSTAHSEHAHTVAVDIRPWENPLRDDGVLITDFDRFGIEDGESFLHSMMDPIPGLRAPWQWAGAAWTSDVDVALKYFREGRGEKVRDGRVDAMHFELDNHVTPSLVAAVDWPKIAAAMEEGEMAYLSEEDQKKLKAFLDELLAKLGTKDDPTKPASPGGAASRLASSVRKTETEADSQGGGGES